MSARRNRGRWKIDARGGVYPVHDDTDFVATADVVIDSHREPVITDSGILDARGVPLIRIEVPIKQQMGFNTGGNAWTGEYQDTVSTMLPADMVRQTGEPGIGVGHVDAEEFDELEDDELEEFLP